MQNGNGLLNEAKQVCSGCNGSPDSIVVCRRCEQIREATAASRDAQRDMQRRDEHRQRDENHRLEIGSLRKRVDEEQAAASGLRQRLRLWRRNCAFLIALGLVLTLSLCLVTGTSVRSAFYGRKLAGDLASLRSSENEQWKAATGSHDICIVSGADDPSYDGIYADTGKTAGDAPIFQLRTGASAKSLYFVNGASHPWLLCSRIVPQGTRGTVIGYDYMVTRGTTTNIPASGWSGSSGNGRGIVVIHIHRSL